MSGPLADSLARVDPGVAWQRWQPTAADPWNLKWAGHLFRRAAFGANESELRQAVQSGFVATLERLLHGQPNAEDNDRFLEKAGAAIAAEGKADSLRGWWIYLFLQSLHPFREKMTLFWHNHFATSIGKVGRADLMYDQNCVLRRHALGLFRPMLLHISRNPAMLLWLDSNTNVKGAPNENYARELMELFSVGVGNFTETDVREAARAFTGWRADGEEFEVVPELHDDDTKTLLGQKGRWHGADVVRIVLGQPAAAQFLVRKLYRFLISEAEDPPAALLEPLAHIYRQSDYDMGLLLKTMFGSRLFFSQHAYRRRIKSPVEFVIGIVRTLNGFNPPPPVLVRELEAMGQELFAPPNVKGWPGGKAWLNTATLLARQHFAQRMAAAQWSGVVATLAENLGRVRSTPADRTVAGLIEVHLQGGVSKTAQEKLVALLAEARASRQTKPDHGSSPRQPKKEASPKGQVPTSNPPDPLGQALRDATAAVWTLPEYQLA
jgi:uncharacterized protein (DUF1800 family)